MIPSQDQVTAQLQIILPMLGTVVSAFGVSGATANHYVDLGLSLVGPLSYLIVGIWSLFANSRHSIILSASKPAAPGMDAPHIVLPKEEADLAQKLPANVTTTETTKVISK
jgi:hypothetical protein